MLTFKVETTKYSLPGALSFPRVRSLCPGLFQPGLVKAGKSSLYGGTLEAAEALRALSLRNSADAPDGSIPDGIYT